MPVTALANRFASIVLPVLTAMRKLFYYPEKLKL
jgi:hypothetical protein